jgi:hypothetical protein
VVERRDSAVPQRHRARGVADPAAADWQELVNREQPFAEADFIRRRTAAQRPISRNLLKMADFAID